MPRLLAFGCSFTIGVGLPDVYPSDTTPSNFAWPAVLGEMLGYEVINNGICAAGNTEIAANVLRTEFKEDDICVILWSHFIRFDYYTLRADLTGSMQWGRNEFKNMLAKNPIDEDWWKEHNRVKNWLTINHIGLYLASKNVKFLHMLGILDDDTYPKPKLDFPNLLEDVKPVDFIIDRGLDALKFPPGHPGPNSHRLIAQLFYDKLNSKR